MALDKHGIIARASFIVRLTGDLTGDMMVNDAAIFAD